MLWAKIEKGEQHVYGLETVINRIKKDQRVNYKKTCESVNRMCAKNRFLKVLVENKWPYQRATAILAGVHFDEFLLNNPVY